MLKETSYLDWNDSGQILNKAYETDLFVLIIGPKGTGKTSLVRDFAKNKNMKLESIILASEHEKVILLEQKL